MKLINNHKDIIEILNKNKDKIQEFELINDEFFLIRFTDGTRVEVESEEYCNLLATYVEVEQKVKPQTRTHNKDDELCEECGKIWMICGDINCDECCKCNDV